MAEAKNSFSKGTMDLDSESRFVENGRFRKAINAAVSRAESSNVGTLRNVLGNDSIGSFTHLSDHDTLGHVVDNENDRVIWFVLGNDTEGIFVLDVSPNYDVPREVLNAVGVLSSNPAYGQPKDTVSRVLEYKRTKKVFNFRPDSLITGAKVRGSQLFFTDGTNEPFQINLDRFTGSGNYYAQNSAGNIRLSPLFRRGENGGWEVEEEASIKASGPREDTRLISDVDPTFDGLGQPIDTNALVMTKANGQTIFDEADVKVPVLISPVTTDLVTLAKSAPLVPPTWKEPRDAKIITKTDYINKNFVFFAYRWTFRDGQQSPLSPFSSAAFYPRRYSISREPSRVNSMTNSVSEVDVYYDPGSSEVTDIEIFITTSAAGPFYSLVKINKNAQGIDSNNIYGYEKPFYRYDSQEAYIQLPDSQRLRIYDQVPVKAKSLDIQGNRLLMGNVLLERPFRMNNERGNIISPEMTLSVASVPRGQEDDNAACSVKTIRDYQAGIVYLDDKGRRSRVIVSENSKTTNGFENFRNNNVLQLEINHTAPWWATAYRPFIRQSENDFYNVIPKNVIRGVSDSFVYLQLDPGDKNKIDAETELVLKQTQAGPVGGEKAMIFKTSPYAGANEGFTTDTNLAVFDIPFEVANENTRYGFAERVPIPRQQSFTTTASNGNRFTIDNIPDGVDVKEDEFTVTEVIVDNEVVTDYNVDDVGGNQQTLKFNVTQAADVEVIIHYTYLAVPPESDAQNDHFVALRAVDGDDISVFTPNVPDADTIPSDEEVLFETLPKVRNDLNKEIYFDIPGQRTYVCANGAHTDTVLGENMNGRQRQILYSAEEEKEAFSVGVSPRFMTGEATNSITIPLDYTNCFSWNTGLEEARVEGDFLRPMLPLGINSEFEETAFDKRAQPVTLIHSGVFDYERNVNRFNEFNISENITIDLDLGYGSIQHLHSRDTNLFAFLEDKVYHIPINKNIIQTTDGSQLGTTDSRYFGTPSTLDGEYGISLNPESFSSYGNRMYWADKNRGVILRASGNNIQEISQARAEAFFRETLKDYPFISTAFDDRNNELHISRRKQFKKRVSHVAAKVINISEQSCPDPVGACNVDLDGLDFRNIYVFVESFVEGLSVGDVAYRDNDFNELYIGDYGWHRIRHPEMGTFGQPGYTPANNAIIQISPYGIITGLEQDCAGDYPPYESRKIFSASTKTFSTPREACASGVVDGSLWHDNPTNDVPGAGDDVYANFHDTVRINVDGYKLATLPGRNEDGTPLLDTDGDPIVEKFVIVIENGVIQDVIDCDIISLGRVPLLGSQPKELRLMTEKADRNLELCNLPHASEIYWHDGVDVLPVLGDTLYQNNFTSEVAPGGRWYTFANGFFVRLSGDSRVIIYGRCSEERCFNTPTDILINDFNTGGVANTDKFTFKYKGIYNEFITSQNGVETIAHEVPIDVNAAVINFVVTQGTKRYPATDSEQVNYIRKDNGIADYSFIVDRKNTFMRTDGGVYTPIKLTTGQNITLPMPTDSSFDVSQPHEVRIVSLCYLGITDIDVMDQSLIGNLPSLSIDIYEDTGLTVPSGGNTFSQVPLTLKANASDPNGEITSFSWIIPTGLSLVGGDLFSDQITVQYNAAVTTQIERRVDLQVIDNDFFTADAAAFIDIFPDGSNAPEPQISVVGNGTVMAGGVHTLGGSVVEGTGDGALTYRWEVLEAGPLPTQGTSLDDQTLKLTTTAAVQTNVKLTVTDSSSPTPLSASTSTMIRWEDEPIVDPPDDPFKSSKAWYRAVPTVDDIVTTCGGVNPGQTADTFNDAWYDGRITETRQYWRTPDLKGVAWNETAGLYAFSFVDPNMVEESDGGGVVTTIQQLDADGWVLTDNVVVDFTDTPIIDGDIDCNMSQRIELGFLKDLDKAATERQIQIACDSADTVEIWVAEMVGDLSTIEEFSSIHPNAIDKLFERDSNGLQVPAESGWYSATVGLGISIIRYWDAVNETLDDNKACSPSLEFVLTVDNQVSGSTYDESITNAAGYPGESFDLSVKLKPVDGDTVLDNNIEWTITDDDNSDAVIATDTTSTAVFSQVYADSTNYNWTLTFTGSTSPGTGPSTYEATLFVKNSVDNSEVAYTAVHPERDGITVEETANSYTIRGLYQTDTFSITSSLVPQNMWEFVTSETATDMDLVPEVSDDNVASTSFPDFQLNENNVTFNNGWTSSATYSGDTIPDVPDWTLTITATNTIPATVMFPEDGIVSKTVREGNTAQAEVEIYPLDSSYYWRVLPKSGEVSRVMYEDYDATITFDKGVSEHFRAKAFFSTISVEATCDIQEKDYLYFNAGDSVTGLADMDNATLLYANAVGDTLANETYIRTSPTSIRHWLGPVEGRFAGTNITVEECTKYEPVELSYDKDGYGLACISRNTRTYFYEGDSFKTATYLSDGPYEGDEPAPVGYYAEDQMNVKYVHLDGVVQPDYDADIFGYETDFPGVFDNNGGICAGVTWDGRPTLVYGNPTTDTPDAGSVLVLGAEAEFELFMTTSSFFKDVDSSSMAKFSVTFTPLGVGSPFTVDVKLAETTGHSETVGTFVHPFSLQPGAYTWTSNFVQQATVIMAGGVRCRQGENLTVCKRYRVRSRNSRDISMNYTDCNTGESKTFTANGGWDITGGGSSHCFWSTTEPYKVSGSDNYDFEKDFEGDRCKGGEFGRPVGVQQSFVQNGGIPFVNLSWLGDLSGLADAFNADGTLNFDLDFSSFSFGPTESCEVSAEQVANYLTALNSLSAFGASSDEIAAVDTTVNMSNNGVTMTDTTETPDATVPDMYQPDSSNPEEDMTNEEVEDMIKEMVDMDDVLDPVEPTPTMSNPISDTPTVEDSGYQNMGNGGSGGPSKVIEYDNSQLPETLSGPVEGFRTSIDGERF